MRPFFPRILCISLVISLTGTNLAAGLDRSARPLISSGLPRCRVFTTQAVPAPDLFAPPADTKQAFAVRQRLPGRTFWDDSFAPEHPAEWETPYRYPPRPSDAFWDTTFDQLARLYRPAKTPLRILDLGPGWYYVFTRARRFFPKGYYAGIDWALKPTSGIPWAHHVHRIQGELNALPFLDCTWPLMTSDSTWEYAPDRDAALRAIYRALRPGGMYFMSLIHPDSEYFTSTAKTIQDITSFSESSIVPLFKSYVANPTDMAANAIRERLLFLGHTITYITVGNRLRKMAHHLITIEAARRHFPQFQSIQFKNLSEDLADMDAYLASSQEYITHLRGFREHLQTLPAKEEALTTLVTTHGFQVEKPSVLIKNGHPHAWGVRARKPTGAETPGVVKNIFDLARAAMSTSLTALFPPLHDPFYALQMPSRGYLLFLLVCGAVGLVVGPLIYRVFEKRNEKRQMQSLLLAGSQRLAELEGGTDVPLVDDIVLAEYQIHPTSPAWGERLRWNLRKALIRRNTAWSTHSQNAFDAIMSDVTLGHEDPIHLGLILHSPNSDAEIVDALAGAALSTVACVAMRQGIPASFLATVRAGRKLIHNETSSLSIQESLDYLRAQKPAPMHPTGTLQAMAYIRHSTDNPPAPSETEADISLNNLHGIDFSEFPLWEEILGFPASPTSTIQYFYLSQGATPLLMARSSDGPGDTLTVDYVPLKIKEKAEPILEGLRRLYSKPVRYFQRTPPQTINLELLPDEPERSILVASQKEPPKISTSKIHSLAWLAGLGLAGLFAHHLGTKSILSASA